MAPVKPITQDLRGFIELLEERYPDEVVRVRKEVDPVFDVSRILDRLEKDNEFPLLIFEKVKGSAMPLIANMHASVSRLQLALGLERGPVKLGRGSTKDKYSIRSLFVHEGSESN